MCTPNTNLHSRAHWGLVPNNALDKFLTWFPVPTPPGPGCKTRGGVHPTQCRAQAKICADSSCSRSTYSLAASAKAGTNDRRKNKDMILRTLLREAMLQSMNTLLAFSFHLPARISESSQDRCSAAHAEYAICRLAAVLLALVGSGVVAQDLPAAQVTALRPGDLDLKVELDERPRMARLTDPMTCDVRLTLTRNVQQALLAKVCMGGPHLAREPQSAPREFLFDLRQTNSATTNTQIDVPAGFESGHIAYPISVLVGTEVYLTTDLLVGKSPAWRVVGPFEGGPDSSHNAVLAPELGNDPASGCRGRGGRLIRWKRFPASAVEPNGLFNLNEALGGADDATAYAAFEVCAIEQTAARLSIGSDDSIKVWHNGGLIHDKKVIRSAEPGQDMVNITLAKGTNTFLVKVCNGEGGWGFFFELGDAGGNPLQGIQQSIGVFQVRITDPVLRLTDVTSTSASMRWRSDVPNTPRVLVRKALQGRALPVWGDTPKRAMVKADTAQEPIVVQTTNYTTRHTATVTGLQPGTRYLVSVDPGCTGIESERLSFYTSPPDGFTQFLRLRLICIVFSNVTRDNSLSVQGAKEPAPASEIEKIKWEMRQTQLFYWVNSGMRMFLDVDYVVDDRFYEIDDAVYGLGYSGKDESALEELVPLHGHKVTDYDGRIFISIVKQWNPSANSGNGAWEYPFGGGGTIGPEEYPGYGKSAWRGGGTSNSAWLFCHEFQHQLDALYDWSMGPEHLFNHFQPWDDTAHRHGEHWDGNGWIFWEWAGYVTGEHQWYPLLEPSFGFRYFTCRWGEVARVPDADNDGIPDDAPSLPLDEKRFGSDPAKADTDGDGLSDMMEVMACRWLEFGLDEIWGGDKRAHYCSPRDADTDKDGLRDGEDPYPIYPVNPSIRRAPNATGAIPRAKLQPFVTFRDPAYQADFQLAWNDEYFVIGMSAPKAPASMRILLDADDDGWFVGHDNYDLRVHPKGDVPSWNEWHANSTRTFAAAFHNCGVRNKWPFYDPEWQPKGGIEPVESKTPDNYTLEIRLRRNHDYGLDLADGEKIGILIAINPESGNGRPNEQGSLTVFEPHTFFTVTLVK